MMRIGQGLDVHPFSEDPDRPLVLGGVMIPRSPGLVGHSDADVVLHAVTDALLGAAALGDLGSVFGSEDPRYAAAPSSVFLDEALRRIAQDGWRLANADCTIVAQRPRLSDYRRAIADGVQRLAGVVPGTINVKATSTDALGTIGRGEGIACLAVVLLERPAAVRPGEAIA
jgi:2-C-methyl-D-erythritol 2,4-cyclodiphosphate synthase